MASEKMTHDMLIKFTCPSQWEMQGSAKPTYVPNVDPALLEVDPDTCKPLKPFTAEIQEEVDKMTGDKTHHWWRMKLTLFSMMVSASFFAAYNVSSFYTGIVIVVGSAIRPILIFYTFMGF